MEVPVPICIRCIHFYGESWLCDAFPKKGIPVEIISGENNHFKPLEEQENDIVFEEED